MIHKIQVALMLLVIPLGAFFWYLNANDLTLSKEDLFPGTPIVHIGEIPVQIEIADTPIKRLQGLSGKTKEEIADRGMLFIFETSDYHEIWMKDMLVPIDIIWISEGLKVVHIERNVSPDTYPKKFRPQIPAKYVVETQANFTDMWGIGVGKPVRLPPTLTED